MNQENTELSPEEREFLDRSLRVSLYQRDWSQEILKNAHVVIGGIGAIGCEVATRLTLMGIGKLTLIDYDIVETSNLSRQLLFRWKDRGKPKVEAAKRTLNEMNRFIEIQAICDRVEKVSTKIFDSADVIVSAVDGFVHRLTLNLIALLTNKPLVEAGFSAFDGHISIVTPNETPCLWCLGYRPTESAAPNPCILRGLPERREHCIFKADVEFQNRCGRPPNLEDINDIKEILILANEYADQFSGGEWEQFSEMEISQILEEKQATLLTPAAVVAGIQTHEIIKLLHRQKKRDIGPRLDGSGASYAMINLRNLQIQTITVERDPECVHCQKFSYDLIKDKIETVSIDSKDKLKDFFEVLNDVIHDHEQVLLIIRLNDISQIWRVNMPLNKPIKDTTIRSGDILSITTSSGQFYLKVKIV